VLTPAELRPAYGSDKDRNVRTTKGGLQPINPGRVRPFGPGEDRNGYALTAVASGAQSCCDVSGRPTGPQTVGNDHCVHPPGVNSVEPESPASHNAT
jgi:hypothetical protein